MDYCIWSAVMFPIWFEVVFYQLLYQNFFLNGFTFNKLLFNGNSKISQLDHL